MKLCPDYGFEFERDRPLWLYVALILVAAVSSLYGLVQLESSTEELTLGFPAHEADSYENIVYWGLAAIYLLLALFFIFCAWLVTLANAFAWWWTMILQVLSTIFYFAAFLFYCWLYVMVSGVFFSPLLDELLVAGGMMSMQTMLYIFFASIFVLTVANVLITYWWWRRRRMYRVGL